MADMGSISVTGLGTRAGYRATIVLYIDIPANTHIEAHEPPEPTLIPTVVEVEGLHDVEIDYPPPRRKDIGIPGAELLVYDDRIRVEVRGRLAGEEHTIRGRIRYQPCVGGACLPARTGQWSAVLQRIERAS
jgi:hypothetical protein